MNKIYYFTISFVFFGTIFSLGVISNTFADTTSTSATIDASVPSGDEDEDDGGGGGGGSNNNQTDSYPDISQVSSSPRYTSVDVSWTASDDGSIKECKFNYSRGTSPPYSKTTSVSNPSGSSYEVELTNLSSSTYYGFEINCTDDNNQTETREGSFKTKSNANIDLSLKAIPEKRVNKNYKIDFYLFIVNPVNDKVLLKLNSSTNKAGKFTASDISTGIASTSKKLNVFLKGKSYLASKIKLDPYQSGEDIDLKFSNTLKAGDVAGEKLKDNFVDVLDLSALTSKFNTTNKEADLNRDGIVDSLDISILFRNFNEEGIELPKNISL